MEPRTLSREEEVELARSKKKVKDYHHAGEMPRAYVNAFDFESLVEEDDFSDVRFFAKEDLDNVLRRGPSVCIVSYLLNFMKQRLEHKVEACPYTIRKGKEKVVPEEDAMVGQDATPRESHAGHSITAKKDRSEVREESQVDGWYGPWMVNGAAQLPPGNPVLRGTSPKGTALTQNMPRIDSMHGAGDHTKRMESVWTPKSNGLGLTDQRSRSKVGPSGTGLLSKGAEVFEKGIGPLTSLKPQAHSHKKHPPSVKGKKVLARGISSSPRTSSDDTHRKFPSAKPTSLSPSHVITTTREPLPSLDPSFKFKAEPNGELEHRSGWSEPTNDQ
nr:hypothetical protein CFP56_39704 [Quercus suber]